MADLSVTASEVIADTAALQIAGTAGETITAGMGVYLDTASTTYKKAVSSSAAAAKCAGIALNGASASQPLDILTSGTITIGATAAPAIGETYYVSGTAGGLQPDADVGAGEFVTSVGIGVTGSTMSIKINATGVAHA